MDSDQHQRGLKRKRSQTSDRKERSESNSVGSKFISEFRSPMAQEWKEKYTSIYLNLLHMAMMGNFSFPTANLFGYDFWEAFTIEFNRLITTRFPKDNFTGFTIKNVIITGRGLEACYRRHKSNSCQLENFADYDRCFNGLCNNIPVFPHFEAPTSTGTGSLYMSRATTSGNRVHMEIVIDRLSTLVNFLSNDALAQLWSKVKGDVNQMAFLNKM